MRKRVWMILAVVVVPLLMLSQVAWADDTDEDGLPDDVEVLLGTDPAVAEEFELVGEDDVTDVEDGTEARHDIAKLWMANVAKGRWLWAIEFAEPHTADNSIVTLYVDADDDPLTGRPAMGCEVAYIHQGGTGFRMTFVPEDEKQNYPTQRTAIFNGVVYFCADVPLKQQDGRTRIRARIHCQTISPGLVRDRWGFVEIEGPGDTDREPIALKQTATIRGVVVNENRWPVAGAQVRIRRGRFGEAVDRDEMITLLTDEDGKFEAEVEPGSYTLIATKDMLTMCLSQGRGQRIYVREGQVREMLMTLKPGGAVEGAVVSEATGEPIADAQVIAMGGFAAQSDDAGNFLIQGLGPGPQEIAACAPGMRWASTMVAVEADAVAEQNFKLAPGFTLRGSVTDEDGAPVEGAIVSADPSGAARQHAYYGWRNWYLAPATTDAAGGFEVAGLSPDDRAVAVHVSHPDFAPKATFAPVPEEGANELRVDITVDQGFTIMGKITGPDGGPVAGAHVSYRGGSRARTTTDANGEFSLRRIASTEPAHVLVTRETLSPLLVPATPGKDETRPWLDIVMEPGHTAKGKVIDQNGAPIAGARVTPYARLGDGDRKSFISQAGGTASDGTFMLGSLPAEGVTVNVRIDGYESIEDYPLNVDDVTTIIMQKQ